MLEELVEPLRDKGIRLKWNADVPAKLAVGSPAVYGRARFAQHHSPKS